MKQRISICLAKFILLMGLSILTHGVLAQQNNANSLPLKEALEIASDLHVKVEAFGNIKPDSALYYLDSIILVLKNGGDTLGSIQTGFVTKSKVLVKQNKLSKAIIELERFLQYARDHGLPEDPFVYVEAGNIYYQLDLLKIAEENYIKALKLRYYDRFIYPVCLNNLGMCLRKQGYYAQARKLFLRTYYFRKLVFVGDSLNPIYSLLLLVQTYNMENKPLYAKHYAHIAIEAFKKEERKLIGKENYQIMFYPDMYMCLMTACGKLNQPDSVDFYYQKAKSLLTRMPDSQSRLDLELLGAEEWLLLKDTQKAANCLKLFEIANGTHKSLPQLIRFANSMQRLMELKKQANQAQYWKIQSLQFTDSLEKLNAVKDIIGFTSHMLESQNRLVQEQQQQQILQGEKIISQEKKNSKGVLVILILIAIGGVISFFFYRRADRDRTLIGKQNKEKELLIREIHHRVKNNLTVISGILDLQQRGLKSEEMKNVFRDAKARINSMALVHKNLYEQDDLSNLSTQTYFENLCRTIASLYNKKDKSVNWVVNCGDTELDTDNLIPLALITNEFLTNSYKHAFNHSSTGTIQIDLHKENEEYLFHYRDNGSGFASSAEQPVHKGLGSQLIIGLSKQLNGSSQQIDADKGVHYLIRFKGINGIS